MRRRSVVALSTYRQYTTADDILEFVQAIQDEPDPYAVISRGGRPVAGQGASGAGEDESAGD